MHVKLQQRCEMQPLNLYASSSITRFFAEVLKGPTCPQAPIGLGYPDEKQLGVGYALQ